MVEMKYIMITKAFMLHEVNDQKQWTHTAATAQKKNDNDTNELSIVRLCGFCFSLHPFGAVGTAENPIEW